MRASTLLLALTVIAAACSPGPNSGASPTSAASSPTPLTPSTAQPSPSSAVPTTTAAAQATRTISGRAAADGVPVAGVRLRGFLPYPPGQPAPPEVTAVTDDAGRYTLIVPVLTSEALGGNSPFMTVQFELPAGFVLVDVTKALGSPPGSLPNMTTLDLGDLGTGSIDIALGRGHVVEGSITSGSTRAPVAGVGVMALRPNSMFIYGGAGDAFEVEASATTDAAGRYKLTVRPGTYVIYTAGPQNAEPRFWSDDPAVFQATPVKVERGVAGVDIALVPVTTIAGDVRSGPQMYTDGVVGARVTAYAAGSPCCRVVGVATTGYGGTFIMHVPQGLYRILVVPPAGSPYALQWWKGANGFATATDMTIGTTRVDLAMELSRPSP